MKAWINVKDRLPPDNWEGLIISNARKDKPVFAHVNDKKFRDEFPFADYFSGRWIDALLTGDSAREKANVIYWLEVIDDELFPEIRKDK